MEKLITVDQYILAAIVVMIFLLILAYLIERQANKNKDRYYRTNNKVYYDSIESESDYHKKS